MQFIKLVIAAIGVSTALVAAEQTLDVSLKVRANLGSEDKDGVRSGLGLGINIAKPLLGGRLAGEFGYTYYGGNQFRAAIPSNSLGVTEANSVLSNKNELNGLYFRAGYGMDITKELAWHAGVTLSNFKAKHESIATFQNGSPAVQQGGWAIATEKSAISVSPFAGLTYQVSDTGAVEFNVTALNYKQAVVTPAFDAAAANGSKVKPVADSRSVSALKFEIGYTFRF